MEKYKHLSPSQLHLNNNKKSLDVEFSSKKNEVFGKFEQGGFSSKINYITHLKDLNLIRLNNNQNIFFVYFLFLIKILKKPIKFLRSINLKWKSW